LGYERYGFAVIFRVDVEDVGAVAEDLAFLRIVEPFEKGYYACLTTA
jgi:hypothetical protein